MGKRKERRLAALISAGRRVKLDLFAEPSGDLVGTSRHDEVGGDLDENHHDGVPNSPSSPGQQQENPLLLLGQYSDDEQDEEENKIPKQAVVQSPSINRNQQVEEVVEADGDKDCYAGKIVVVPEINQESVPGDLDPVDAGKNPEDGHMVVSSDTAPSNPHGEANSVAQECVPGTSGMQIVGAMTSEWKIVMHEQTNQYYYWNTVTGETSWEVPEVLNQGMETTTQHKVSDIVGENGSGPVDEYVSDSDLNREVEAHLIGPAIDGPKNVMETSNEGAKDENGEVPVADQTESKSNSCAVSFSCMEASMLGDSVPTKQSSGHSEQGELIMAVNGEDDHNNLSVSVANTEKMTSHSAQLVKYGESLLERLKAYDGPGNNTQDVDWRSKYILEVHVRLSDCKALSAYGSSLLPFWWYTEMRLKQVQLAIDEEEVSRSAASAQPEGNQGEVLNVSSIRADDTSQQSNGTDSEVYEQTKGVLASTVEDFLTAPPTGILAVDPNEVHHKPVLDEDVKPEHVLASEFPCSEPAEEVMQEVNENMVPAHSIPKTALHAGEDVDMDVDMEVDDGKPPNDMISEDAPSKKPHSPSEQSILQDTCSPSAECLPLVPDEEFSAPPPPDDDWIPPPPPDNEPIPPPPPDEPLYPPPPPYSEPMPPLPFTEQYNMAYTVPTYEYYAPTHTEVMNSNYFPYNEGGQIPETQLQSYYEPSTNIFPEAVAPTVNPAEPVVYYDAQNGSVPPLPIIGNIESSGFYVESGPVSYHDNASSGHAASLGVASEPGYHTVSSLKTKSDFTTIGTENEMASVHHSSISGAAQTSTTTIVSDRAVAAASTAVMAATSAAAGSTSTTSALTVLTSTTAATKSQAKVLRSKKRTIAVAPTLRSNKKVTSLVDKWKAAKEELHADEEDEPENAYEILERKKQREIEEWRARQIASGEAQDNANFQPLGGDWRERVKRKRAKSTSDVVQTPAEVSTNDNHQPDLIELSKDLPPRWQVYWDESSKQIYYGNAITSETTWTRPTR